jgi:predicted DNA binding CopG/RHH family protein
MSKVDEYELEVLEAYEKGHLKSIATKTELAKLRAAARAIATKDRRVNIRLSAGDVRDIQVKALEEGVPYQTLIASVLQVRYRSPSRPTSEERHWFAPPSAEP